MITRVGPATASDLHRKRGPLSRMLRIFYRLSGAAWFLHNALFINMRAMQRAAPYMLDDSAGDAPPRKADLGIPEAEISEAQQQWATLREKRDRSQGWF